jgi:hypothetical protein
MVSDVFSTLQDAAPHLSKGSSVVIISSIAGYNPPASMAMYGVTKTALLGLTKVGTWLPIVPSKTHMDCYCLLFVKSDSYYVNMMCRPWLLRWLQKL